jgi:hypothetical protein
MLLSLMMFPLLPAASSEVQTPFHRSAGQFIAMLQPYSGQTRHDIALRVDEIAMMLGSDVETRLLWVADSDKDWDVPAAYPIDYLFTLTIKQGTGSVYEPDVLEDLLDLEWIEPDFIGSGAGQRSLTAGYGARSPKDAHIFELPSAVQPAHPVKIAVLDTGIEFLNAALAARVAEGYNFLTDTTNPQDDHGQGTSAAGIIVAQDGSTSSAAEAASVISLMPLKVLDHTGRGFYSDFARAIRYAVDHGAQVINLGVGGPHESRALQESLRYAVRKGVTVVSPMMNDGSARVYYPAAYPETIAVGAVSRDHRRFSNVGDHIDVVAYGDNLWTTDLASAHHSSVWWGNANACAIVSRLVAFMKARSPTLSPARIKEVLQRTAQDQRGDPLEDIPGWDSFYGHGLIDAHEALKRAQKVAASDHTVAADERGTSPILTFPSRALREAPGARESAHQLTLAHEPSPLSVFSSNASSGVQASWNATTTNTDGSPLTNLAGYKLYYGQSSRNYTSALDVGNQTTSLINSLASNQTYYFAVTAYTAAGLESDFSAEVSTSTGSSPSYNQRVNAGGKAFIDGASNQWGADQPYRAGGWGYVGGGTWSTPDVIANTTADPLYQTERYGTFSYKFDIPNGHYDVVLHFAEIYWNGSGQRLFDVRIEGALALDNYDIYKAAGHDVAMSLTFPGVLVADGQLSIEFAAVKDLAKISAIHIQGAGVP